MKISDALAIAEGAVELVDESTWEDLVEESDKGAEALVKKMEEVTESGVDDDAAIRAVQEFQLELLNKFFFAGVIWRDNHEESKRPEFTVAVDTTEFLKTLVENGSLGIRFVLDSSIKEA